MKIGVIGGTNYVVADSGRDWDVRSFVISPDRLSFFRIFDSAFATPARYVEEIFLRLCELEDGERPTPKLVCNPLFDGGKAMILPAIAALRAQPAFDGFAILKDRDGAPLGYLLPSWLERDSSRYLTLLSAVDSDVDAALCRLMFGTEPRCISLPHVRLSRLPNNGFLDLGNRAIYRLLAQRAIATLRASTGPVEEIPFTAFMPHHAGDTLFFVLAFNRMHSHVTRIAVSRAYQDVVRDNAPGLEVLPLDAPVINRDDDLKKGIVTPESVYFHNVEGDLPRDSFYYFCRPSRDYNATKHHLIDHFGFALGGRLCTETHSLARRGQRLGVPRAASAQGARRVLLHFDAGWPLKVYPRPDQDRLIDLLHDKGYAVTVLAENFGERAKCRVTSFKSYAHFKTLVQTHDILVGMDSFPAHYAAHVRGLPTICLFASTRPENSNAPGIARYAFLEKGLSCRPCYARARCPLYGQDSCRNFVGPEIVADEIDRMLARAADEDSRRVGGAQAPFRTAEQSCRPDPAEVPKNPTSISLRFIDLRVAIMGPVWPIIARASSLRREFLSSLRTGGFRFALIRTFRYLRSLFRARAS